MPFFQAGFLRGDNGELIFSSGPAVSEQGGYPVDANGAMVVQGLAGGNAITAVNPGSISGTYTLNCNSQPDVIFSAYIVGNITITVANIPAPGRVHLLLVQDTTGGRVITISNGAQTITPTFASTAAGAIGEVFLTVPYPGDIYWRAG